MDQIPWLLLLYSLPTKRNTERVAVWRRFKKIGALQLTTSTYLLPDQPTHHEHFQWLAKLIRDSGGEATLIRVREIEGLSNEKLVEMFDDARDREYAVLSKALRALERSKKARVGFGRGHAGAAHRPQDLTDAMEHLFQSMKKLNQVGRHE